MLFRSPRRGAIAFFDFPDRVDRIQHVGLVEAVLPGGRIQTIEGNTSSGVVGSQSDGGGVYRRIRPVTHVALYGYPDYTVEGAVRPAPRPDRAIRRLKPLVVDGVWGKATTTRLQILVKDTPADGRIDDDFRRYVQRWLGVRLVDLMRRASGRHICQPGAVDGELVRLPHSFQPPKGFTLTGGHAATPMRRRTSARR